MPNTSGGASVKEITRTRVKLPNMYHVIFHNDDVTTMDFVVQVLISVFHKSAYDAEAIMLNVHHKGAAVVGTYTYDMAITRRQIAIEMAQAEGFPLKITIKPE